MSGEDDDQPKNDLVDKDYVCLEECFFVKIEEKHVKKVLADMDAGKEDQQAKMQMLSRVNALSNCENQDRLNLTY